MRAMKDLCKTIVCLKEKKSTVGILLIILQLK